MMKFKSLLFCLVLCAIVESSLSYAIGDDDDDDEYDYDADYYNDYVEEDPEDVDKRSVWGGQPIPNQANGGQYNNEKRSIKKIRNERAMKVRHERATKIRHERAARKIQHK